MVFLQYLYDVVLISSRSLFLMMMMMMMMNLVFAGPTGLTLKLIHRDSPESPLYPGNLTQLERMERAFQQSIDREQQLTAWMKSSWVSRNNSRTNSKSLDMARPRVFLSEGLYMVEIGLGSFPNQPGEPPGFNPVFYYFLLDTGSNLLWLQCQGNPNSTEYFNQDSPLFSGQNSFTYQALPARSPHPICRQYSQYSSPVGGFCGYGIRYADGSSSLGILAKEKLTVNANNGLEVLNDFVFGCGLRQINEPVLGKNDPGKNLIAGVLGLGGGIESFIRQLGGQSQNKFEYCLKPLFDTPSTNTFLRFGSDTNIVVGGQGVQTTPIIPVRGDTIDYVIMEGISVGGNRVFYPDPSVFGTRPDGTGGCIFDSGCALTQLSTPVYEPFKNLLIAFFNQFYGIRKRRTPEPRYELCFNRPKGFVDFPTITFHYSGADFDIEPYASFTILGTNNKVFCLNIRRTKVEPSYSVILGSLQQVNRRILYDLGQRKISWREENCATLG